MLKYKSSLLAVVFWVVVLYSVTENNYGGWRFIELGETISDIKHILSTGETLEAIFNTVWRVIKFFLIIGLISVATSILSYKKKSIEELLKPLIYSLKSIPVVASIILIHLIFDSNNVAFIIVFLMVFPILHSTFSNSLNKIPSSWERHNEVHGVSRMGQIIKMYLPVLFFRNKTQIVTAIGLSMKAMIAAEILTWMQGGVGEQVKYARDVFDTNLMFAWLIILVAIIIIFDFGFKKLLKAGDANA